MKRSINIALGLAALAAPVANAGGPARLSPVQHVSGGEAGSRASHATSQAEATTRVTVIARDSRFTLSRRSAPIGRVIFAVTNKGKISHDFKIAGKKTPLLSPGHSATLRVAFSKKGRYPYLSTVPGQGSADMKGVFSIVAPPVASPVAPPPPPYTPPTGPVGTANTTVTVKLLDLHTPKIVLSQKTIPSGMVTFAITSKCTLDQCSFDLEGIKAGALLSNDQTETWTVPLPAGIYRYHCDMAPDLMKGSFTVTP